MASTKKRIKKPTPKNKISIDIKMDFKGNCTFHGNKACNNLVTEDEVTRFVREAREYLDYFESNCKSLYK